VFPGHAKNLTGGTGSPVPPVRSLTKDEFEIGRYLATGQGTPEQGISVRLKQEIVGQERGFLNADEGNLIPAPEIEHCIRANLSCAGHNIGDGRQAVNVGQVQYIRTVAEVADYISTSPGAKDEHVVPGGGEQHIVTPGTTGHVVPSESESSRFVGAMLVMVFVVAVLLVAVAATLVGPVRTG
jgi:hypothetical protein